MNAPIEDVALMGVKEAAVNLLLRNVFIIIYISYDNIQMSYDKVVDMVSTEMVCNPDQFRRMDLSVVFYSSGTALLVPWPGEQSRLLAPIRPFDSTVLYSLSPSTQGLL